LPAGPNYWRPYLYNPCRLPFLGHFLGKQREQDLCVDPRRGTAGRNRNKQPRKVLSHRSDPPSAGSGRFDILEALSAIALDQPLVTQ
jgi:hypothetical protein